jgi:hypothetical protein
MGSLPATVAHFNTDTWDYTIVAVASALWRWTQSEMRCRNPKRAYVWICSLCLNQHRIGQMTVSPQSLAHEFGSRVQSIGRLLTMLEPWHNPLYLTRAWCLFELYTAIGSGVEINVILTVRARTTKLCARHVFDRM